MASPFYILGLVVARFLLTFYPMHEAKEEKHGDTRTYPH
jgi:hypothetical protein